MPQPKRSRRGCNFRKGWKKPEPAPRTTPPGPNLNSFELSNQSLLQAEDSGFAQSIGGSSVDLSGECILRTSTPTNNSNWQWPVEETPPSLEKEFCRPVGYDPNINNIQGRRIVDVAKFITDVRKLENHECRLQNKGYLSFDHEKREGLRSSFVFRCTACKEERLIYANGDHDQDINVLSTWGSVMMGKGHSPMNEMFAFMDIPYMSQNTYRRYEQIVGQEWLKEMTKSMAEAAEEEHQIAKDKGNIVNGDIATCTVIVDGSWSHRSYGHSYSAKSGVACIIGKATKKILFLSIRNKYCSICAIAQSKCVPTPSHTCYCNWTSSSSAMESDILAEGFKCSENMYKLRYTTFIGDGDSNVHSKILESVPYSRQIRKIECANHLVKNMTKHLHIFANENKYNKKLMPNKIINHIGKYCRKIISLYSKRADKSAQGLKIHILQTISHVYGNHTDCEKTFCLKAGTEKQDNLFNRASGELKARIMRIVGRFSAKSESLIEDTTSNLAELYMHLVAKFTGGKQVFYGRRNSYNIRCYGAALSFNSGPSWLASSWRTITKRSPNVHIKRIVHKKAVMRTKTSVRRKLKFVKEDTAQVASKSYGEKCECPDLPDEEVLRLIKMQIQMLDCTSQEQLEINTKTIGQADNELWHQERFSRLTASRFGDICKRRGKYGMLVKDLLYGRKISTPATEYGKNNEDIAAAAYEVRTGETVEKAGLFVCVGQGKGYMAASPDGLVGHDKILEVKCPYNARELHPHDICSKIKNFYCNVENGVLKLKQNHNYFYQVQGQMFITGRRLCDFVVWTPKGFTIETIEYDPIFVRRMLEKLEHFYFTHFGPELVDSRKNRNLEIRDSS